MPDQSKKRSAQIAMVWDVQSDIPPDSFVGVIEVTQGAKRAAGGNLIREAHRYPDRLSKTNLSRPLSTLNEDTQTALAWLGAQIVGLMPLAFTTETAPSPTDEYQLIVTREGTTYNFRLEYPETSIGQDGASVELRTVGNMLQWRQDDDNPTWEDLFDLSALQGEPGADGANGADGAPGATGATGAPGADGASVELRISGDFIQWRQSDDSPTWTNIIALDDLKGEQGEQGVTGLDGPQGAKGDKGDKGDPGDCECGEAPERPPEEEGDGWRCGVAINVANYLQKLWFDAYENSGGLLAGVEGGTVTLTSIAAVFFPAIAVPVAILNAVIGVFAAIVALDQVDVEAFDADALERYRCMLYCILPDDGNLTQAILNDWADLIEGDTLNPAAATVAQLVRSAPFDAFQWIAYAASEVNPEACDCGCEEDDGVWCYRFEFAGNEQGFSRVTAGGYNHGTNGAGGWAATDGINTVTNPDGAHRLVNIQRSFAGIPVTEISIDVSFTGGTYDNTGLSALFIGVNGAINNYIRTRADMTNGDTTHTLTASYTLNNLELWLRPSRDISSPYAYSGAGTIKSLTLKGTGVNPFGADNCTP